MRCTFAHISGETLWLLRSAIDTVERDTPNFFAMSCNRMRIEIREPLRLQVRPAGHHAPGFHLNRMLVSPVANSGSLSTDRFDPGLGESSILPGEVNLKAATGAKSLYESARPGARQRRQQIDYITIFIGRPQIMVSLMALKQHLRHARHRAKIAVDLEWRMRVKQIRICATCVGHYGFSFSRKAKLIRQQPMRVVAVAQARPEISFHAMDRPVPSSPRISNGLLHGVDQLGGTRRCDLIPGKQWK